MPRNCSAIPPNLLTNCEQFACKLHSFSSYLLRKYSSIFVQFPRKLQGNCSQFPSYCCAIFGQFLAISLGNAAHFPAFCWGKCSLRSLFSSAKCLASGGPSWAGQALGAAPRFLFYSDCVRGNPWFPQNPLLGGSVGTGLFGLFLPHPSADLKGWARTEPSPQAELVPRSFFVLGSVLAHVLGLRPNSPSAQQPFGLVWHKRPRGLEAPKDLGQFNTKMSVFIATQGVPQGCHSKRAFVKHKNAHFRASHFNFT